MRILVVEDEPKVASFIKQGLEEQCYETEVAFDGFIGRKMALQNDYDIIILDVIIPYMNGIELCKEIRQHKPTVPILMLTALGTTENKLEGFEAGTDDYLVKPFEFRELLARIRSLTKRSTGLIEHSNSIKYADLELDLNKKLAKRNNKIIALTSKEFHLLEFLMRNKDKVVTRAAIAEAVWEITFDTGTNVVDVYINLLRKKIDHPSEIKLIHTRVGHGYLFTETP
jgi:two-component system, OmpR family, copper resistance phosphate regulon response regulator CusR